MTPEPPGGGDFGAPSTVYPAYHPPVPQVQLGDGAVIARPRVVEVFFADDDERTLLEDFTARFATSREWAAMVGEYGVGPITVGEPVVLAQRAPAQLSDIDVRAILDELATDDSTILVFHVPLGVAFTFGGTQACEDFTGYHASLAGGAPYAVITTCIPPWYVPTTLDLDTSTIGHELVEAVTDPQPASGYGTLATPSGHWGLEYGTELADLCELSGGSWYQSDLGYYIQRSFSNAAIAGYHEYCVPAQESVFFTAAPAHADAFTALVDGQPQQLAGTLAHVGQPTTIDLDLISDGPTGGPFSIEAIDDTSALQPTKAVVLDLQLDRTSGENGEIVHLTITPQRMPESGFALFTLRSTLGSSRTYWKGVVSVAP